MAMIAGPAPAIAASANREGEMREDLLNKRASCTEFKHITQKDCDIVTAHLLQSEQQLPDRLLQHFQLLGNSHGGLPISRRDHSLQTATRMFQAGLDEESIVCGLLHDLGDMLSPHDHGSFAALVLKPYIGEKNHWIVKHHEIFQGYYYYHLAGFDRNARDAYRSSPHFNACVEFCERFDQNSFDPDFENMPLEAFEPMVHRVLAKPVRQSTLQAAAANLT